jgi:hypothetical protein
MAPTIVPSKNIPPRRSMYCPVCCDTYTHGSPRMAAYTAATPTDTIQIRTNPLRPRHTSIPKISSTPTASYNRKPSKINAGFDHVLTSFEQRCRGFNQVLISTASECRMIASRQKLPGLRSLKRARKNSTRAQTVLIERDGRDIFGRARCGKTTFTSTRSCDLTMPSVLYRATKVICVCALTIESRYPAGLTESLTEVALPRRGDTRLVLRIRVICVGSNEIRSRPQDVRSRQFDGRAGSA